MLRKWIKGFLSPPVMDDDENASAAFFLHAITLWGMPILLWFVTTRILSGENLVDAANGFIGIVILAMENNVTVHLDEDMPFVHCDRQRLLEVVKNLVDNAAKFMGDQSLPYIEIGQDGWEGGMLIFYVRDNGIGIRLDHHERVFGLFNKLNVKSDGTGIGLALVKRIIEVHGGRVWIQGEWNKDPYSILHCH